MSDRGPRWSSSGPAGNLLKQMFRDNEADPLETDAEAIEDIRLSVAEFEPFDKVKFRHNYKRMGKDFGVRHQLGGRGIGFTSSK